MLGRRYQSQLKIGMGNSGSGGRCEEEEEEEEQKIGGSSRRAMRRRFSKFSSTQGSNNKSNFGNKKLFTPDVFSGIARIQILQAEMKFKDKWFACFSLGQQTFKTATSDHTEKPVWKSEKKVALEANGPRIARISIFETNVLRKNNLVGYCEIDLTDILNADYNEDGKLSLQEFSDLIRAFGNKMPSRKEEELFKKADHNGDGVVNAEELCNLLTSHVGKEIIINRCPVCGEMFGVSDSLNDMIHVSLCFDEGTGNQIMTGGFLTEKQASYGWMFKLSEWAHFSTYDVGLKSGSTASHILVFDRRTKRLVEEVIEYKIVMSLRAIYQSKLGLALIDKGTKDLLQSISKKQGERMSTRDSAKDISKFINFFEGRKFSVRGLLGDEMYSQSFDDGVLVIFRLAPQDYHRFHIPISGVIGKFSEIPGHLYTVNPIAVNSKYCNVFSENKRVVCMILSEEFGKMAFVAIGATMVGSITFTKYEGDVLKKGDELGYFSFGGSTVVCVFEKDAIDLDEDLLLNGRKSLETLVSVGMSLGISKTMSKDQSANTTRPGCHDSVDGLDNEVVERGVRASTSTVINRQIDLPDEV